MVSDESSIELQLPDPVSVFDLEMEDGAIIRIRQHGDPDKPVRIYLSHGNGFAIDGYLPFWGPLCERAELIVFDFRNHGQNPPANATNHDYPQMTRDLERVFQEVTARLGPKTGVGAFHSMSARAAMKHAIEIGWRWDALVLYDPPNFPPEGHPLFEPMRAFELKLAEWARGRRETFADPAEMAEEYAGARAHSRWAAGAHDLMARAILRRDDSGDRAGGARDDEWVLSCPVELEAVIYEAALTLNLWPRFEEYGGPTMLIGADPEMEFVPPTGKANQALAGESGYDYKAIPGTGHLLQLEKPNECIEAMVRFLAKCGIAI